MKDLRASAENGLGKAGIVINNTREEAWNILQKYGKCAIVRPAGFGKTFSMTQLAQRRKKTLYLYPSDVVKNQSADSIGNTCAKNTVWMSYAKVGKYHNEPEKLYEYIIKNEFDFIICDEIHHMGANNARETLEYVLPKIDTTKTYIVGGTATPGRMDGYDVIDSFFGNYTVSEYTINDAITDGVMRMPYYIYALYNSKYVEKQIKEIKSDAKKRYALDPDAYTKVVRDSIHYLKKMTKPSNIIRDRVRINFGGNSPNYMKFLIFFKNKTDLEENKDMVRNWFNMAFNNKNNANKYSIRELIIHSSAEYKNNVDRLCEFSYKENTIDLIYSINMINEGYHVDEVTGVVLLRSTKSNIVYNQQIGRCMQVGKENNPIVFDFVANIKIGNIFNLKTSHSGRSDESKVRRQSNNIYNLNESSVQMIDYVAKYIEVVNKSKSYNVDDEKVVEMRIKTMLPTGIIAKELKMLHSEVNNIIKRYEKYFIQKGLQDLIYNEAFDNCSIK